MTPFSQLVFSFLLTYKYAVLFPAAAIEGPLITFASGFLVSQGIFNPFIAFAVLIASDLVSDLFCYGVGHYGKSRRIARWFLERFKFERHKERLGRSFRERGAKIVFWGKITHALAVPLMIAAGYFRMNILEFLFWNFIGAAIKSAIFMYIGFAVGAAFSRYASGLADVSLIVMILATGLAYGFFVIKGRNEIDEEL